MSVLKIGTQEERVFYTWGPLGTNVGATVIGYGETWHTDKSKTNQKDEDIDHHKIPRQLREKKTTIISFPR
jgi:CDP-glycerol glycerophosphotransferase (TagB/SpsB family)